MLTLFRHKLTYEYEPKIVPKLIPAFPIILQLQLYAHVNRSLKKTKTKTQTRIRKPEYKPEKEDTRTRSGIVELLREVQVPKIRSSDS